MPKYTIFVAYSLIGNDYTEKPILECTRKLYDTPEEAVKAIANEIEIKYNNKNYYGLEVHLPSIKHYRDYTLIRSGYFKCAYCFGPMVHYDIYLTEIQ